MARPPAGILIIGFFALMTGISHLFAGFTLTGGVVFANFVAVFGLVDAIFVLFATHDLAYGLGVALLPAVVLWYLNQPRIEDLQDRGNGGLSPAS